MAHAAIRPAAPPSASATGLSAAPRWERLRDHGHGRRPSPTQTAPRGGRGRDYLVGGGRSASHVPYPDLAGRHRGQAAIGATGVTGAALNSLFYRSRVQPGAVTADASWLHRAWMIVKICGIVYHSTANRRPGAPRLGWPGGCPTAPPMACPRHVAPPHPAVLAHVSRGAGRFSCARPARGGAHVGKAVPCGLGGPREAVSGCLREAAGAELRRGRALRRGNTALGICVRSVGDAKRPRCSATSCRGQRRRSRSRTP